MIVLISKIQTEVIRQSAICGSTDPDVIRQRTASHLGIDEQLVAEAVRVLDSARTSRAQAFNQTKSNGQCSRP